jgi:UDP-N-acetyl-D-mannosaminuronic acid dehydrogenase
MLSAKGLDVTGSDFNENLIVTLNDGKTTFEENGLCDANESSVKSGWRR